MNKGGRDNPALGAMRILGSDLLPESPHPRRCPGAPGKAPLLVGGDFRCLPTVSFPETYQFGTQEVGPDHVYVLPEWGLVTLETPCPRTHQTVVRASHSLTD